MWPLRLRPRPRQVRLGLLRTALHTAACPAALMLCPLTFCGAPAGPLHSVVLSEPAVDVNISGKVVMITGASRGANSSPLASLPQRRG